MMTEGTKTLPCPECGEGAHGNFCQNCGASLGGRFCNQCGSKVAPGGKFCSDCGSGVLGGGASQSAASATRASSRASLERKAAAAEVVGGQNLAWWVAGVAMFALILFVGITMVRPGPGIAAVPAVSARGPARGGSSRAASMRSLRRPSPATASMTTAMARWMRSPRSRG